MGKAAEAETGGSGRGGRRSLQSRFESLIGYTLGTNPLAGIAAILLLLLSGYATWSGMSDFILGVQGSAPATVGEQTGVAVRTDWLIAFLVFALTLLMWLALRETFGARRRWRSRIATGVLYVFLAIWSIGFGYGFWWSLIAGSEATKAGLSGQAEDVRDAAVIVKARLEAVRARLGSVVAHSERQMAREASSGGSCGIASGAGQGPLFRAREGVRDSVAALQADISTNWLSAVDKSIEELGQELAEAGTTKPKETLLQRQAAFEKAAADIRGKAGQISAQSNSLGAAYASQMQGLAKEVSIPPRETGFSCYDPTLANLLREAAGEAGKPLQVNLRAAAFSEGAAGVANAVLGLWTNMGEYLGTVPAYIMGTADLSEVEGQGVTGRDLIALLAAIGVDLGLLILTMLSPPGAPRLSYDVQEEIARAIRKTLERADASFKGEGAGDLVWLKRHFVHHGKSTYFVVPNFYNCLSETMLDAASDTDLGFWSEKLKITESAKDHLGSDNKRRWWPFPLFKKDRKEDASSSEAQAAPFKLTEDDRKKVVTKLKDEIKGDELERGQSLNLLAGVLVDIQMIRLMSEKEINAASEDEARMSRSVAGDMDAGGSVTFEKVRNHGVLSKARHALKDGGWSRNARKDPEIYILIDNEGLSPFLKAVNTAG